MYFRQFNTENLRRDYHQDNPLPSVYTNVDDIEFYIPYESLDENLSITNGNIKYRIINNIDNYLYWNDDLIVGPTVFNKLRNPFTRISFSANDIDECYFSEITLSAFNTKIIDLMLLEKYYLQTLMYRTFKNIKYISIQNTSTEYNINISSQLTKPVIFINGINEIGPNGVFSLLAKIGIEINPAQRRFILQNPSNVDIKVNLLIMGQK